MSEEIIIRFNDLDIGSHSFDFEIDKEFFEKFDYYDFINCNLKIKIDLIKDVGILTLIMNIKGSVEVECDRCLDSLTIPIDSNETLFIKEGENNNDSDNDNIIHISKDDIEINLSNHIFDIIVLSLPMKKIHPSNENGESTCNATQLAYLTSNNEEKIDPRWEALNKLKN
ncbi:MAG: DUF177 domain-containing protein [Bacteroidales bacterium]|jgi:uncharacterized metal-binding protein YceD (DUF177 family)|nr:DUF177 domain-containing protein [Bacteroidales bacterium]